MSEKDWKRLYEELLQRHETKQSANQELEELLGRTITRLTVAAMGLDQRLDPHLKKVRDLARKGISPLNKEQLNNVSDGLLHYSQEEFDESEGKTPSIKHLLDNLSLDAKELTELEGLVQMLVSDPAGMQQKGFNRMSQLLGQGCGVTRRPGLFDRLFGGEEVTAQSGPGPNEILLNLLEHASWPGHWGTTVNELKLRLQDKKAPADTWTGVLEELLALAQWAADSGKSLSITPTRRYFRSDQEEEIIEAKQGKFEDWM